VEHSAGLGGAQALLDGCRAESILAEVILVRRQAAASQWATGALDASGDVLPDGAEDALPEPLPRWGEDAGKLAGPVLGGPEPDAKLLPPALWEHFVEAALCRPDAVLCAVRSFAATVPAVAAAQWARLVSLPLELAVEALASAESPEQPESQLGLQGAAQPAYVAR
jgi:hypothetical protein